VQDKWLKVRPVLVTEKTGFGILTWNPWGDFSYLCVSGLKSQDLEILWAILAFLKNGPLWENFQNSVPKVFTASPIDVVVFKCRKICPTGNRWNHALFTWRKIYNKIRLSLLPLLSGSRSKSARASRQQCAQCSRFHPNPFTFGGVTAVHVNSVFAQ